MLPKDIMITYVHPANDFLHDIVFLYPKELDQEKILNDNLKKLPELVKLYIKEKEVLEGNKQVLRHLKFKPQQDKQRIFIDECERVLNGLEEKMNDGLNPYCWKFYNGIDTFDYGLGMRIKADYAFALTK